MKAFSKDIVRSILKGKKRFFAIMIITVLGVAMFSGLKAACVDLRTSADRFFRQQNLHDLYIVSTLGLTQEDVEAVADLEEVQTAEGGYSETIQTHLEDRDVSLLMQTISPSGIDAPYLVEGRMPEQADEVAVTQKFLDDTGVKLGDSFTVKAETDEDADDAADENTDEDADGITDENTDGDADEDDLTVEVDADFDTEDTESHLLEDTFTITGIVVDVTSVTNPAGSTSFRDSTISDNVVFMLPEAVDADYYTYMLVSLTDAADLFTYSDAYEDYVADVRKHIEQEIKEDRETARREQLVADAEEQIDDAEAEADEKLADAYQELTDGEQELEEKLGDARQELEDGEQTLQEELADAKKQLEDGEQTLKTELADGYAQLKESEEQLEIAEEQLAAGLEQLQENQETLDAAKDVLEEQRASALEGQAQLEAQKTALESQQEQIEAALAALSLQGAEAQTELQTEAQTELQTEAQTESQTGAQTELQTESTETIPSEETDAMPSEAELSENLAIVTAALAEIEGRQAEIEAGLTTMDEAQTELDQAGEQLAAGWAEYEESAAQLEAGKEQLAEGWDSYYEGKAEGEQELADGWAEYYDGKAEGEQELADGWAEYEDGKAEGEQELADGWAEYEDGKAEAEEAIADARAKLEDIDTATWYVQDRNSLNSYTNIGSDADSIEAIGTVFPIVFLIVAILISLTTVTRMVDEDRGLIGTYKALGYSNSRIRRKFEIYAGAASVLGSFVGTIFAFLLLPMFICRIFTTMYLIPSYTYSFVPLHGLLGPIIFVGGILVATILACRGELAQTPAALMRPKAPKAGSRVLLERIPWIWNRMSFLNKVTARNLFRYKKRMTMTIAGIAGCMALLLFGFAIKDSVNDLMPRQYEQTSFYDLMLVGTADDNETLLSYVADEPEVENYINAEISSVTLQNADGEKMTTQIMVIPDGTDTGDYLQFRNLNGEEIQLEEGDIYITENAGNVLGFSAGDVIHVQLTDLTAADVTVTTLVQNYLGNYVYMTASTFEDQFEEFEANGILLNYAESCQDQVACSAELSTRDGVLSCVSTQDLKDQFSQAFTLINMVVYVVIVMSAALAFVVLFTLSTTNISERQREMATIKVLGFYDREVHLYVNKETLILTVIGILVGIPIGKAFAGTLTSILNLPSIYLAVSLHGVSYLISAVLSFGFALIVNVITNRSLNQIDPVEALKSVE